MLRKNVQGQQATKQQATDSVGQRQVFTTHPLVMDVILTMFNRLDLAKSEPRVMTVEAPPGSGKTTLITSLVETFERETSRVARTLVATNTRAQAKELYRRIARVLGEESVVLNMSNDPDGKTKIDDSQHACVVITTIQKLMQANNIAMSIVENKGNEKYKFHLLVVDEGYQARLLDIEIIRRYAHHLLLVGDPGQIGPVNTVVGDLFRTTEHVNMLGRAQEHYASRPTTVKWYLNDSYRLGPEHVRVIAPGYDFEFASRRPERRITTPNGQPVPEIAVIDAGHIRRDTASVTDATREIVHVAVERVRELLSARLIEGGKNEHTVEPSDIVVLCGFNAQTTAIYHALETEFGHDVAQHIALMTADKAQGQEWPVAVVVDPMIAPTRALDHAMDPRRLVVMLSRSWCHTTWIGVSSDTLRDELQESEEPLLEDPDIAKNLEIRDRLKDCPALT